MDSGIQNVKKSKFNILRFAIISVLLGAVMVASFWFYGDEFAAVLKRLDDSNNDMTNMTWVVKHLGNLLPGIAIVIFQAIAYSFVDNKVVAHKEQKWQALLLLILVYGGILPYAIKQTEAGVISSIESSSLWFCTQLIPLIILMVYHSQRGNILAEAGENKETEEAEKETEEVSSK